MNTESPNFPQILNEIYVEASEDPQFKEKISKDGIGVLKERGVLLPENAEVHFLIEGSENSKVVISIPLVPPLNDEAMESVAGGTILPSLLTQGNAKPRRDENSRDVQPKAESVIHDGPLKLGPATKFVGLRSS